MITLPRRKPREEEHHLQCNCVRLFRTCHPKLANLLFAVPNGGRRDKVTAAKLKAEGVVAGVADLILLIPNKHYHAMLIELKTPQGRQGTSQKEWQKLAEEYGYKYVVCRSVDDFFSSVERYIID